MLVLADPMISGCAAGRPGPVNAGQRLDFDRIAERRPGAVRLHVRHVQRAHAGRGQRLRDHLPLRRAAGDGQAAARAVLVDGGAANQSEDGVAIGDRIAQSLENHDPASFTARIAVGGGVEGFRSPVGGQHASLREADHHLRREDQVHAAGQRRRRLVQAEALTGEVQADQR